MRIDTRTALELWPVKRNKKKTRVPTPPKMYSRTQMPIVDAHMHIYPHHDPDLDVVRATKKYLQIMDACGVDISVNLSGLPDSVAQADELEQVSDGRILICPGTYFRGGVKEFWWTQKQLEGFAQHSNVAGLKIWCKYEQPLLKKSIDKKLNKQAQLGIPAIGMHIADPPTRDYWAPNFWECISDAERVIKKYPQINFIMAHGFWLMTRDADLDVLATLFDAYPHLHVDLSAAYHWWENPDVSYDKLRQFIIDYKERIVYGTDGNPAYSTPERYAATFAILESKKKNLCPFFGEDGKVWNIHGLNLPNEVLNYIYYWNAARLVPNIRRSLLAQGFTV